MALKAISVCVLVLIVEIPFGQCFGPAVPCRAGPFGFAGPAVAPAAPYGPACGAAASTGGGFPVTSASPIAPTGVSIVSENAIEGALSVGGNLPLLGSVGVEGAFATAGAGGVSYGCGDGAIGIVSEAPIDTGILSAGLAGPGLGNPLGAGLGFGSGLSGFGRNVGFGIGRSCGAIY